MSKQKHKASSVENTIRLTVVNGPAREETCEFQPSSDEWLIGRSQECAFSVMDPRMSRKHFSLRFVDGRWRVRDLGSSNSTTINGLPLASITELNSGDQIKAGDTLFELQIINDLGNRRTIVHVHRRDTGLRRHSEDTPSGRESQQEAAGSERETWEADEQPRPDKESG